MAPARADEVRDRAGLIVEAFNEIGCAAFNVGDRDLSLGVAELQKLAKKAKFPFVSTNLRDKSGQKPLFETAVVAKTKLGPIGIIGLLSPTASRGVQAPTDYAITDPIAAAKEAVKGLAGKKVAAILLLSQLDEKELEGLLKAVPEIDLVFGSQRPERSTALKSIDGRLLVQSYLKGKYLGIATLHMKPGSKARPVFRGAAQALTQELRQLDARIRSQERQLKRFHEQGGPNAERRIEGYRQAIKRLVADRTQLEARIEGLGSVDADAPFVTFELAAMGRTITAFPGLQKKVDSFNARHPGKGAAHLPRKGGAPLKVMPKAPLKRPKKIPQLQRKTVKP